MFSLWGGNQPEQQVERLLDQGERLFQHGRAEEALAKFMEAAALLPEAAKPGLYLARAYTRLRNFDAALKQYYKALYFSEMSEEPEILFEIAQIYLFMKRYDLVEEKLQKVLHFDAPLSPIQIEAVQHTALKALTQIYLRTGRFSDAIAQQQVLLARRPDDLAVLRMLADLHRKLGEYREARAALRKALELAHYTRQDDTYTALEAQLQEVGFPDGQEIGIKEHLYANYQSLCLGTAGDDGVKIPLRATLRPLTLPETVVTLKRLIAFIHAFQWPITCIVPADKSAYLPGHLLAYLLDVPVKTAAAVARQDTVLICQTCARPDRALKNLIKRLSSRANAMITFALMARIPSKAALYCADIVGIPVRETPAPRSRFCRGWFRPKSPERTYFDLPETLHSLKGAVRAGLGVFSTLSDDDNLARQLAYYRTRPITLRPYLVSGAAGMAAAFTPDPRRVETLAQQLFAEQPEQVFGALSALHHLPQSQPWIVETLKTAYREQRDANLRRMIGKVLLGMAPDDGVAYLIECFQQPETDTLLKRSILETVSLSFNRTISPVIAAALQSSHYELKRQAVHALDRLDLATAPAKILEALLHDAPELIAATLRYLRTDPNVPDSPAIRKLLPTLLRHHNPMVVHETLDLLEVMRNRSARDDILELFTHPDQAIVIHAIQIIGELGNPEAMPRLLPFLDHDSPHLRYAAVESLMNLDPRHPMMFLIERLRQETPDVQQRLLQLIGQIGSPEVIPYVLQFAEDHADDPTLIMAAVKALAHWPDPRSLPVFKNAVETFATPDMLREYLALIDAVGTEQELELAVRYLDQPPEIQLRVAALLYRYGQQRYFHILQDGVRSKYQSINLLTIDVLAALGDELSVHTLLGLFERQSAPLDRRLVDVVSQPRGMRRYAEYFRRLPESKQLLVTQGVLRAIRQSQTEAQAQCGCDCLYVLRQQEARPMLQKFCNDPAVSSSVLCGVMRALAARDPQASQHLIQNLSASSNVVVANTAHALLRVLALRPNVQNSSFVA